MPFTDVRGRVFCQRGVLPSSCRDLFGSRHFMFSSPGSGTQAWEVVSSVSGGEDTLDAKACGVVGPGIPRGRRAEGPSPAFRLGTRARSPLPEVSGSVPMYTGGNGQPPCPLGAWPEVPRS